MSKKSGSHIVQAKDPELAEGISRWIVDRELAGLIAQAYNHGQERSWTNGREEVQEAELAPARYPQRDLFICDIMDFALKDIRQQLETPLFALSKKPDTRIRRYENGGDWVEITPSARGRANIYDKDILIFAVSALMWGLNRGERISQRLRVNLREFLVFANRGVSTRDYRGVGEALIRLGGTRITTNIRSGGVEQRSTFGFLEASRIGREVDDKGRLLSLEVKVSDWLFNAVRAGEVLTLHRDYFRLRRPLERRVYEVARKHCGYAPSWRVGLGVLRRKCGVESQLKEFRYRLGKIAKTNHLPGYQLAVEGDMVLVRNRKHGVPQRRPRFRSTETYERAKAYAGGRSVYELEREWLEYWRETGAPKLENPEGAFIGYCKRKAGQQRR